MYDLAIQVRSRFHFSNSETWQFHQEVIDRSSGVQQIALGNHLDLELLDQ